MRWASAGSTAPSFEAAVREVAGALGDQLDGVQPDLAIAFVSPHHAEGYGRLPALLAETLPPTHLIGCSAGGVIGGGSEIEGQAGLSVSVAVLPDVTVRSFYIEAGAEPGRDAPVAEWEARLGVRAADAPQFVLLPDPLSCDAEAVLQALDRVFPSSTTIGGLASGGQTPGAQALYHDATVHRAGLVGLALTGNVIVDTIVAQGCRPIGEPMFVTRADQHLIFELDGHRPLDVLQGLAERADARDRRLFGHSLFVGVVMRPHQGSYQQGDFLIRNILGLDGERGALAVGAAVEPGAVVQFHLRDAETSAADLESLLARYRGAGTPAGALLFSCLGRGAQLYGEPDHDSGAFARHVGDVPLGGFFCNGEIGPVQGATFLHGYTSAFGLFRPRRG